VVVEHREEVVVVHLEEEVVAVDFQWMSHRNRFQMG
jgi:hypothetical protein